MPKVIIDYWSQILVGVAIVVITGLLGFVCIELVQIRDMKMMLPHKIDTLAKKVESHHNYNIGINSEFRKIFKKQSDDISKHKERIIRLEVLYEK